MTIFLKIIGRFRWLAFLIGAAIVGLFSWLLWPMIQNPGPELVTQKTQVVHDSSGIQSLRDSLAMMRSSDLSVRVIRMVVRDTVNGVETVYLDSGAVRRDTVVAVHVIRDTLSVTVHDTIYRSISQIDAVPDNDFKGYVYYDDSKAPGIHLEYSRRFWGPFSGVVYSDYQNSLESGMGLRASWKIFTARAVVKNYGIKTLDLGYSINAGVDIGF